MADVQQVQVWIDRDYTDGVRDLKRLLATVAPQIEPFDTLSGMVSQIDNYISGFLRGDKWTVDKWRSEYGDLLRQADEHVAELNRRGTALQRIALMADTGSEVYKHFAEPYLRNGDKPSGWRIAEKMREIANDVIGSDPICDSCGREGQVQLTDEGGNRAWWACPACRASGASPTEIPERVEGDEPECPWCHVTADIPACEDRQAIDCECGGRYEAERATLFISRPMECRR